LFKRDYGPALRLFLSVNGEEESMRVIFGPITPPASGTAALVIPQAAGAPAPAMDELDERLSGLVRRALALGGFRGDVGQYLTVFAPQASGLSRVILVGGGVDGPLCANAAGSAIATALGSAPEDTLHVVGDPYGRYVSDAGRDARIVQGFKLARHRCAHHKTSVPQDEPGAVQKILVHSRVPEAAEQAHRSIDAATTGVCLARDLVTEPANVLYPESFAQRCRALTVYGLEVDVLDPAAIESLGMGALLAVAQGSAKPPRVVTLRWRGGAVSESALVGKGVTFDSGGLALKPRLGMEVMKYDMAGAAAVVGAMVCLAQRRVAADVVGIIGLVENMPDGAAVKPGDVVKTLAGLTVEVINPDAEGRLVLADLLHHVITRYRPSRVIDIATLTGSIVQALGGSVAGVFSTDGHLADALVEAGRISGEQVWPMPLPLQYEADITDLKNLGPPGEGGCVYAALFLKQFVGKTPWAHLDIAGPAWLEKASALGPKGATGFGVRLLNALF
jgi:leucyl aminopeptidase